MRTTATRNLPARWSRVLRRFARWRQTRQGYARIPEGLWGLAVPAAGQYGLYPTAQEPVEVVGISDGVIGG